MPVDSKTTFEISTRGEISDETVERARDRLTRVANHCREPVGHVEIRLIHEATHHDQVRAEATLAVKHGPVRAHAVGPSASEAVDTMIGRLRGRLSRHESKLHRIGTKRNDGTSADQSWHHGDVETAPRRPLPVVTERAQVVRRKSFAGTPMSVADAVLDLELLDHDFYLVEHKGEDDASTNSVCLLSRNDDGSFDLASEGLVAEEFAMPDIHQASGACVLSDEGAQRLLDSTGDRFVFYRHNSSAQPEVLYRRFDGDFGMIELG